MTHRDRRDAVLSLRGVGYQTPSGQEVLRAISLDLLPGEKLSILGPNGSGKSTLLKLCVALLEPTSGQIALDGNLVAYTRAGRTAWRTAVQLVMQEPDDAIFATTVRADVAYGPMNLGLTEREIAERTEEALAAMGIADLAERIPQQLSYGQRKRVVIAGALAMRPRVLLLDEPTAGLDPQSVQDLAASLDALHAQGTSLVVTTHEVDFAYRFSDHTAFLVDHGLVVGHRAELFTNAALVAAARVEVPWAVLVEQATGAQVSTREEFARWIAASF